MTELLSPTTPQEKPALPPLKFTLSPEHANRLAAVQKVDHIIHFSKVTEVEETSEDSIAVSPDYVAVDLETLNAQPEKVQQVIATIAQEAEIKGMKLKVNFNKIAESGLLLGHALSSLLSFISVACPHCAAVAIQTVSAAGKVLKVGGGLGHWHGDTYHEGDHSTPTGSSDWIDNPFKWLEVDRAA